MKTPTFINVILGVTFVFCAVANPLSADKADTPVIEIIKGPQFSQNRNDELHIDYPTTYLPLRPPTRIKFKIKNTGNAIAYDVKYTFIAGTRNFDPELSTNGDIDNWNYNTDFLKHKLKPSNKETIVIGNLKPNETKEITLELNILNQIKEAEIPGSSRNYMGDYAEWLIILRIDYQTTNPKQVSKDSSYHRLILSDPVSVYFLMG